MPATPDKLEDKYECLVVKFISDLNNGYVFYKYIIIFITLVASFYIQIIILIFFSYIQKVIVKYSGTVHTFFYLIIIIYMLH